MSLEGGEGRGGERRGCERRGGEGRGGEGRGGEGRGGREGGREGERREGERSEGGWDDCYTYYSDGTIYARGALPLVGGVCWGVTAGKPSHNASNARGHCGQDGTQL